MLGKRGVTLGKSRTQKTWDGLDQGIGSDKGIVLAGELLDELLVFVQLFQIVSRHGVNTMMLCSINIMLVS